MIMDKCWNSSLIVETKPEEKSFFLLFSEYECKYQYENDFKNQDDVEHLPLIMSEKNAYTYHIMNEEILFRTGLSKLTL